MRMTDENIRAICEERFKRWTEILVKTHSTPMMLVAVGHDQVSGKVSVIALEDLTDQNIFELLSAAANGM